MSRLDAYRTISGSTAVGPTDIITGTKFVAEDKFALDVTVLGGSVTVEGPLEVQVSGLTIAGKITTFNVTTTATKIPATALADRNSIAIRNLDPANPIYLGFEATVEANENIGTDAGWKIDNNETFSVDITDSIDIYLIASTTVKAQIMEVA